MMNQKRLPSRILRDSQRHRARSRSLYRSPLRHECTPNFNRFNISRDLSPFLSRNNQDEENNENVDCNIQFISPLTAYDRRAVRRSPVERVDPCVQDQNEELQTPINLVGCNDADIHEVQVPETDLDQENINAPYEDTLSDHIPLDNLIINTNSTNSNRQRDENQNEAELLNFAESADIVRPAADFVAPCASSCSPCASTSSRIMAINNERANRVQIINLGQEILEERAAEGPLHPLQFRRNNTSMSEAKPPSLHADESMQYSEDFADVITLTNNYSPHHSFVSWNHRAIESIDDQNTEIHNVPAAIGNCEESFALSIIQNNGAHYIHL